MKKFTAILAIVLVVTAFAFTLTACTSVEGTYYFDQMSYTEGGVSVEIKAGEKFMGMVTLDKSAFVLTLEKGGKATMKTALMGEALTQNGTWEKKNDKYVLKFDDEEQEFTVKGNDLTLTTSELAENATLVLKKG